jgi:myo-inositol 2-dehydrogenase / D-chiro-inositol 1-dehydrogenase
MTRNDGSPSRRDFLKVSGAALVGSALAPAVSALPGFPVHQQGSGTIKVGLLGCGGRGSGAAANALSADPNVELVAMGDVFADMLEDSLKNLKASAEFGARVKVDEAHKFVGLDAYKGVIEASDVVLLCTTPAFRPLHLRACVDANKHTFVEKPVAVDGPGLRDVIESCKLAQRKRLNLVSGLCYRYERKKRETIKRIQDGAVGTIVALQCTYNTGGLWHRGRQPSWTEMEYQIRNWLYFSWLSGDHTAEQHIHSLDKLAWAMKDEYPVKCVASGGRANRTQPEYGNVYDHFNTVFEWKSGLRGFSSCRQWKGAKSHDVSDYVFGTVGKANIQDHVIWGEKAWRWKDDGTPDDMYQNEHDALFAALRKGEVINNGEYMCHSTLMAIMARMSAYTGQEITFEQALESKELLGPPDLAKLTLKDAPPPTPLAVPGVTQFS